MTADANDSPAVSILRLDTYPAANSPDQADVNRKPDDGSEYVEQIESRQTSMMASPNNNDLVESPLAESPTSFSLNKTLSKSLSRIFSSTGSKRGPLKSTDANGSSESLVPLSATVATDPLLATDLNMNPDASQSNALGLSVNSNHYNQVLGGDPKVVAKQLVLASAEKFQAIEKSEFIFWIDKEQRSKAVGIQNMSQFFNQVSIWVSYTVLQETQFKKRVQTILAFVTILKCCTDLNDFNTAVAVLSGLQSAAVCRLEKSWSSLSKKDWQVFAQLSDLLSPNKNWENYRTLLRQAKPPCIPYLGLYLSDLGYLHEAKRYILKQSASNSERALWEKEQQIYTMLDELDVWRAFAKYTELTFHLTVWQQIESKLSLLGHEKTSNFEESMYKRSNDIEPTTSDASFSPIALYFSEKTKMVTSRFERRSGSTAGNATSGNRPLSSQNTSTPLPSHLRPLSFMSNQTVSHSKASSAATHSKRFSYNKLWFRDGSIGIQSPTDVSAESVLRLSTSLALPSLSERETFPRTHAHEKAKSTISYLDTTLLSPFEITDDWATTLQFPKVSYSPKRDLVTPEVKAGGETKVTEPAYQVVSELEKIGNAKAILEPSFSDVQSAATPLIKSTYRVSVSKKNELNGNGKKFSNRSWRACSMQILTVELPKGKPALSGVGSSNEADSGVESALAKPNVESLPGVCYFVVFVEISQRSYFDSEHDVAAAVVTSLLVGAAKKPGASQGDYVMGEDGHPGRAANVHSMGLLSPTNGDANTPRNSPFLETNLPSSPESPEVGALQLIPLQSSPVKGSVAEDWAASLTKRPVGNCRQPKVSAILRWTSHCHVSVAADYRKHKWVLRLWAPAVDIPEQYAEKHSANLFEFFSGHVGSKYLSAPKVNGRHFIPTDSSISGEVSPNTIEFGNSFQPHSPLTNASFLLHFDSKDSMMETLRTLEELAM